MFGTTTILSDVGGLQLAEHVHLPVAACLAVVLLPVGFLLHHGQEVVIFILFRRHSSRLFQADGGTAGFSNGGVGVVVKVVVGGRCFSPACFTPGRLPLSPLPLQRCLGLDVNKDSQARLSIYIIWVITTDLPQVYVSF